MRTKLDILKVKVSKFERELKSLDERIDSIKWRRQQEVQRVLEKYFTIGLQEGIRVTFVSDKRIEYTLLDDSYSNIHIERVNLADLERSSWSDELVDFKAYTNGLSLKNLQEMEIRANLQISIAQLFNDFKDDAIAEINLTQEKYDRYKAVLIKAVSNKRKDLQPFNKELMELQELEVQRKLLEGIELELQETRWGGSKYPAIEVKFDYTVSNVKNLKVKRFSASGKSADIEVVREWKDYDGIISTRTENIERVRVDKFKRLVKL